MSQKINPTSVRLGVSQIWDTSFPKYGKNFQPYINFLHKQLKIFVYLRRFFSAYNFSIENVNMRFTFCSVFITVFIVKTNSTINFLKTNILVKTIYHWLKIPIVLNFYKKVSLSNSAFLVSNYITYLTLRGTSLKKSLQIVYIMLKDQSNKFKLVQTVHGTNKVILKGFKLKFSGCFEVSRSQMSKTISCNFGSLPLTKLKGYVEYSSSTIYTKLGSCGLKI